MHTDRSSTVQTFSTCFRRYRAHSAGAVCRLRTELNTKKKTNKLKVTEILHVTRVGALRQPPLDALVLPVQHFQLRRDRAWIFVANLQPGWRRGVRVFSLLFRLHTAGRGAGCLGSLLIAGGAFEAGKTM